MFNEQREDLRPCTCHRHHVYREACTLVSFANMWRKPTICEQLCHQLGIAVWLLQLGV